MFDAPEPRRAMTPASRPPSPALLAALAALAVVAAVPATQAAAPAASAAPKPALTVTVVEPQRSTLALTLPANGNIAAWQEASVGAEGQGLRLAEVLVNVGDAVRKGQLLASFASDLPAADLAATRAAVAEAEAARSAAAADAARARELQPSGALSAQQVQQYLTAEASTKARVESLRAQLKSQELRLAQTRVLAPDAGIISARAATVGAVVPPGIELFRLIRQGRLEWRAEVPAGELHRLQPGQVARLTGPAGQAVQARVRMVGPTVDAATRNGLVYVDLPAGGHGFKPGMHARGQFEFGASQALTLPQAAVVLREGFAYVFRLGAQNKVAQVKVAVGRRVGDRVEITSGLDAGAKVVASGGGFLADGDTVRVVAAPTPSAPSAPAAPAAPAPAPAASR